MNRVITIAFEPHFHIRWLRSGKLDWERHYTVAQAEKTATELSYPHEEHAIEQFDEACLECSGTRSIRR